MPFSFCWTPLVDCDVRSRKETAACVTVVAAGAFSVTVKGAEAPATDKTVVWRTPPLEPAPQTLTVRFAAMLAAVVSVELPEAMLPVVNEPRQTQPSNVLAYFVLVMTS